MANKTALILTPHIDFAGIVKQTLAKVSSLDVNEACSASEADKSIRQSAEIAYALLDLEMGTKEVLRHGTLLKEKFPEIKLVLISKKEIPLEMDEIRPWSVLKKPFVERELFSLFRASDQPTVDDPDYIDLHFQPEQDKASDSLKDEKWVKKTIQEAMSKMDVQEALVFSKEGLIVHSGEMIPETIDECTKILREAWKDHKGTEIILPIHLDSTNKNHILHSNLLAVGLLLALAYDGETSLKVIRSQSRYLSRLLKNPQLTDSGNLMLPERAGTSLDQQAALQDFAKQDRTQKEGNRISFHVPFQKPDIDETPDDGVEFPRRGFSFRGTRQEFTRETNTDRPIQEDDSQTFVTPNISFDTRQNKGITKFTPRENQSYSMSLINPNMVDVYFACALVPRLKSQSLEYDLAEFLREEMPNIFLAYGWRLEKLVIEPFYLQWLVGIPPTLAPASHVKVIRKQTSKIILSNFTGLNKNELLQDFWAPGYLVGSGRELLPAEVILEFIRINRWQHYPDEE